MGYFFIERRRQIGIIHNWDATHDDGGTQIRKLPDAQVKFVFTQVSIQITDWTAQFKTGSSSVPIRLTAQSKLLLSHLSEESVIG
jgi:hypothetical protein